MKKPSLIRTPAGFLAPAYLCKGRSLGAPDLGQRQQRLVVLKVLRATLPSEGLADVGVGPSWAEGIAEIRH